MKTILTAARLLAAEGPIDNPVVILDGPRIEHIGTREDTELPPGEHHDYPGAILAPAFFDIHFHGCRGRDVMEATEPALGEIGRFLAQHGVGAYLATTITAPKDATLRSLSGLGKLIQQAAATTDTWQGARPVGIHIEGPFLSHAKKGAHPAHDLLAPDVTFFNQMWEASEGQIRLMTIAPELPGALDVIARANELGVRVSLGHSNATFAESEQAIAAGAHSATHTFNAMRAWDQREPGILGAVLGHDALYAELICDGLHVHPAAVRLWWKAKGPDRAILITDAMSATGMPDGTYKLGDLDVRLENGRALIGDNTLAGSTLTLDQALRNFMQFTGAPLEQAIHLVTHNPWRMAGLTHDACGISVGDLANFVVLTSDGNRP